MRQILSDIRALPGVTGVAVITKRTGHVEHLFPAAFTDNHTRFLRELITTTYQRLHGFTRLALRFERVIVHLYNQPEYLLFVTVLPDTDTRQFEQVVNSKFGAVSRHLGQSPGALSQPGMQTRPSSISTVTPHSSSETVTRLLAACNHLTDALADSRGRVNLANDWRLARDIAGAIDPSLEGLTIDAAGRLNIRKGCTLTPNADLMSAFAKMMESFLDGLGTQRIMAEEELYMLLEPHRALYEPAGLYMYLGHKARTKGTS